MAELNDSILDTTKKMLGFESDYTAFDLDIITHINSVFFTLTQLNVGPTTGFLITDKEAKWADFIGPENVNAVKSYMYMRVRLMFDPPTSSFALDSMKKLAEEIEWRLYVHTDPPVTTDVTVEEVITP
ncbi:hypothetical protein SEA_MEDIUMFRY_6 [Arthrobacter phage MediumFry]|nr:hypothetical protein SEA_MEDIUMFRY_6 [Arthrobacter phage MediumFry]